jgi:hypothetical protein
MNVWLKLLFTDCFAHLGQKVLYQSKNKGQSYLVQVLSKQPDRHYEVGEGQFVWEMLILEVSVFDVLQPMVGDIFVSGDSKYKVHSPPLRDNSEMIWKIHAMSVEG